MDPLTQNPYTYSTTNDRQEYEIGAITEKVFSSNNEGNETYGEIRVIFGDTTSVDTATTIDPSGMLPPTLSDSD